MWRVTDEIPTKHPIRNLFMTMFRDTLFTLNSDDVKNVHDVCKKKGSTFEEMYAKRPKWIMRRVCRKILQAHVLAPALTSLIDTFKHEIFADPKPGSPLLNDKALAAAAQLIKEHVEKRCLSDPPEDELTLYYKDGTDSDGLIFGLYLYTRGIVP
jgi:hypothetical protein